MKIFIFIVPLLLVNSCSIKYELSEHYKKPQESPNIKVPYAVKLIKNLSIIDKKIVNLPLRIDNDLLEISSEQKDLVKQKQNTFLVYCQEDISNQFEPGTSKHLLINAIDGKYYAHFIYFIESYSLVFNSSDVYLDLKKEKGKNFLKFNVHFELEEPLSQYVYADLEGKYSKLYAKGIDYKALKIEFSAQLDDADIIVIDNIDNFTKDDGF